MSEVPIQVPSDVNYSDDSYQEDREDRATSKGFGSNLIVSQKEHFKMTKEINGVINIRVPYFSHFLDLSKYLLENHVSLYTILESEKR